MASFSLFFKQSAERELRKIPTEYVSKIMTKIASLAENPRPVGIQRLKGENRYFRLRQGDYRIIYEIDDSERKVTVIKIGHRREVYE